MILQGNVVERPWVLDRFEFESIKSNYLHAALPWKTVLILSVLISTMEPLFLNQAEWLRHEDMWKKRR